MERAGYGRKHLKEAAAFGDALVGGGQARSDLARATGVNCRPSEGGGLQCSLLRPYWGLSGQYDL